MKFKIQYIFILVIAITILSYKISYSENNYSGFTYIISTGPSYINGFYSDYINHGFSGRFNTYYNVPLFAGNTYFKGALSYSAYTLKSNSNSDMKQMDLIGGAGLFFTPFPYLDLLAGVDVHGIYSNLKTGNTQRDEKTLKPGISLSTGAMTYLGRGLGLCILADYRRTRLSEEKLSTLTLTAGLTYNYNAFVNEQEQSSRAEKKLTMFNQGLAEFKKKNFNDAKSLLHELYGIDKNYPGLDYYMKRIEEIEQNNTTADALIEQQNYLKAIPHLEGCSAYIKDCELKLLNQRKTLKANVPAWESEGIRLYDGKNYKGCIELMERILLVDPENQNANIYLPRAIKRQKAIESLQGR
jgi:tetratricopeptide (TPR) repeat protein